jgi:hypothetical protein
VAKFEVGHILGQLRSGTQGNMASSLRSAHIVIGELVGSVVGIEENIRETEIAGNDPITLSTDVPLRKKDGISQIGKCDSG